MSSSQDQVAQPSTAATGASTDLRPVSTSVIRRQWGASVFSIVAEGRPRRRPSDITRVVVAGVIVAIASVSATDVSAIEAAAANLIAALPDGLDPLWNTLYLLGPILAGILLVTALLARQPRLFATQALAMIVGGLIAAALSAVVDDPSAGLTIHGSVPEYPVLLLAVSFAGLWACRPYVTRPARRMLEVVGWLSALGAVALGEGLPGAVIASLALAWGAAALAQLCFGTPAATPSADDVAGSLRDLGVDPDGLRLAPEQTWGATSFSAGSQDELSIEVVSRDSTDAHLLAKIWRFVWYKDSGPTLSVTRELQVEHQAYVLFLADRTGARLPDVVAAGEAGWRDDAFVVVRNPAGVRLDQLPPEQVTDAVLDDAWSNLGRLHLGRIAHGNPWVGNVVVDDAGTTGLIGLGDAATSASDGRLRLDRVQLLATTAQLVGQDRALASAHRSLSTDELVDLLAFLEPSALTGVAKHHLKNPKGLLTDLRKAGAELTGVEPPAPTELHRFSLKRIFVAAAFASGVYLLVAQLAGVAAMGDIFAGAIWGWVLLTFVLGQLPQFSQAVAMLGAVSSRLPFGPVTGVQFANAFTGLVGGTAGNATLNIRFFQKQGLPPAVAASSGVLTATTGFIVQAVLIVIAVVVTGPEFDLSVDGDGVPGWLLVVIAAMVVGGIVLMLFPGLRKRVSTFVSTQVRSAWDNVRGVLATPRKAVQLFGGNLATQLLYALVLGAALHAYGESLPVLQLVLINCIASFIGGAAPVPGGMGVIETGMIAGFTASGIPEGAAVAATFTARMCTSYLPPIWGWFTLSWLRKKDYV